MAVFDPTQQIQQIGQSAVAGIERMGQQYSQNERLKTAQTERMLSQLSAIREEAAVMHQDFLQEKIQETQASLADQIFKQRKNGQTKIDVRGFAGLNKEISKLKNIASNSQSAAQKYDEAVKRVMADPYVFDKGSALATLTNIISDASLLESDPENMTRQIVGVYGDSVDIGAKIGDYIADNYGTEKYGYTTDPDKQGRVFDVRGERYADLQDERGNITKQGASIIADILAKSGSKDIQNDLKKVAARLSSSRVVEENFTRQKMALEEEALSLRKQAEQNKRLSKTDFNDGYARYARGILEGKINDVVAGSGAQGNKVPVLITKKDLIEGGATLSPEIQDLLSSAKEDQPIAIAVGENVYAASEDGLKASYRDIVNSWVGDESRGVLQSYDLSDSGITESKGIFEPMVGWKIMNPYIKDYAKKLASMNQSSTETTQTQKSGKASESTLGFFK